MSERDIIRWADEAVAELRNQARGLVVFGVRRKLLIPLVVHGPYPALRPVKLADHPSIAETLESGVPCVGVPAAGDEPWFAALGRSVPPTAAFWPVCCNGRPLALIYCEGDALHCTPAVLRAASRASAHLQRCFRDHLSNRQTSVLSSPLTDRPGRSNDWPTDLKRTIDEPGDSLKDGLITKDAAALLRLALNTPEGPAARALPALDDWLTNALTGRFLDTALEALIPLMEHLPVSRGRLIRVMINADDADLRKDALHCLERWPDEELAREILPLAFAPNPSVAIAASRVLERCKSWGNFETTVLKELRSLLGDSSARSAHRRAMELLIRLRDEAAVPLLADRLDDERLSAVARRGLADLTLLDNRWSAPTWARWWTAHASVGRTGWILEALNSRNPEVRSRAVAELYGETGDNFGYDPNASVKVRRAAVERVRETLTPH